MNWGRKDKLEFWKKGEEDEGWKFDIPMHPKLPEISILSQIKHLKPYFICALRAPGF